MIDTERKNVNVEDNQEYFMPEEDKETGKAVGEKGGEVGSRVERSLDEDFGKDVASDLDSDFQVDQGERVQQGSVDSDFEDEDF